MGPGHQRRRWRMWQRLAVSFFLVFVGCAAPRPAAPPSPGDEPTSQPTLPTTRGSTQPLTKRAAQVSEQLHGKRFSELLDFEKPSDALFVSASPSAPRIDASDRTSGKASLLLAPNTQRLTIKLSSLLAGREFPADWTLV